MKCFKDTIKHSLILALVLTLLLCALPGISAIAAAGSPPSSLNSAFGSFYGGDGADFVLDEVLIPAASRQNAQEIADAYSLKLLSYAWGIAVLAASDPLETVAQSDLLNSLMGGFAARSEIPKLSLNRLYSTYTDDRKYDMEHSYFSSAGPYAPYDRTDREGYAKTPPGRGYEEKYGSRISGAGEEKYGKAYPGKVDEERYASSHSEKTDRERYTRTLSYEDDGERYASVPPYKYSEGMQANSITPGFDRHSDQGSLSYGFETSIKSKVIDLNSKLNTQHSKLGLQSSPAVSGSDSQWHHELMDTERAWDLSLGEGALVAVIDTGIDLKHPKFDGRISETSYDSHADRIGIEYVQDDEGHGTHVSGIIAASLDGDEDVCGVAPKADILMIKANIPSAPNFFESASLYRAINYAAANGADVINMSLGRNYADGWNEDELEHEIIINAVKNGVTVVCAAGNESNNHAGFPAAYPETIAVSALRWGGIFDNSYSNYGPEIDIAAPGSDIYSTANGGDYMYLSGTSMASPNVAGVAALIKSLHPEYTPGQVRDVLCETARAAGALGKNDYYGWGIVNAYGAVLGVDALYKVTYDFNDGERESVTVRVAPKSMLIEPTWPERDGYAFDGWFISSTDEEFDFTAAVENDLTLEAKWVETEDGMYILEFPDPNFRREVLRQLNQEDGGKRRESNFVKDDLDLLAAWDFLYVSYMSIFDMTGLKYLSGLIWLYCSDNYLVALDVSNSTELESLDCSDNQINELDLANNNKLSYLNCSRNEFTNLDLSECTTLEVLYSIQNYWLGNLEVSKNINLRELFCGGCQLTELDVSNNSNLEVFNCSDNLLTELDITKNTKLGGYNSGYFVYPGLDCSYNQLTTLDVSKNLELNIIICCRNQLTELDVSRNIALKELFCGYNLLPELDLTKNTELMHLGCSDNKLTTLDVSQNTKLTHIGCRNNNLTDLDVSKNIDLSFINCYNNQLTKLDVSNNIVLEGLNCDGNLLTELYVAHADLSGMMGWWYLSGNEIYDPGLQCNDNRLTALDISQTPALKLMDCGFNFLTELDVSANTGLEWLNCTYNYMKTIDNVSGWETISGLIPDETFYFYPQCSGDLPTGKDITASFKDPSFLTAIREIIGKPEGPILDYDVTWIWGLDLDSWNNEYTIYDLSGIEHFKSLTYLNCSGQQLEELDLSNNGALRDLNCYVNLLTELNLSENTNLVFLNCGYNQLEELNLSNNPKLEWLYCYDNQLKGLDVSNNSELAYLLCDYNQLVELDLSNNPELRWFYCFNNNFSELNVSNNPELRWLDCSFNQLEVLDVSCNFNLESLAVWDNRLKTLDLSNNSELRTLDCDFNQLAELDVSNNALLETIYCSDNQLKDLYLVKNSVLEYLYCYGNELMKLDLFDNPKLMRLGCGNNLLTELDMSGNPMLESLYCYGNKLTEMDVSNNPRLIELSCGNNPLMELDLSNNPGLEYLNCYHNELTELDISSNLQLMWLYCNDNLLKELDLSNNPVLRELECEANQLANLDISNNPELVLLGCSGNQLADLDLSYSPELMELRCNYNLLTDLDMSNNAELRRLNCYDNRLTELDLSKNTVLEFLECGCNQLSELDISNNPALREFFCSQNRLAEIDVSNNPELVTLYCSDNQLKELNLSNNPQLMNFSCSNNILAELDVSYNQVLLSLWCDENQLTELNLENNSILESMCCSYNRLAELDISKNPKLYYLDCYANQLEELNLGNNPLLEWLYCGYNQLTKLDLSNNPELRWLDCSNNILTGLNVANNPELAGINCSYNYLVSEEIIIGLAAIRDQLEYFVFYPQHISDGISLSGKIKSYNPNHTTIIQLMQGKEVVDQIRIDDKGSGQVEQSFTFKYVEPGTYDLVVIKPLHTRFTVKDVIVGREDLDLANDSRPEVQLMTLRCGDINGDGLINDADLTILWRAGNYNRKADDADNRLCDLNGDGLINDADLTILWLAYNYNRGPIVIEPAVVTGTLRGAVNGITGDIVEFGGKDYFTMNTLFYAFGGQTIEGDLWLYPRYDF